DVFLTGASGYAGQHVLAEFVRRGLHVTAFVRKAASLPNCSIVVGDLNAVQQFADRLAAAQAIVYLARLRSYERYVTMMEIVGTSLLLEAWRNGPFIYVSSAGVERGRSEALHERMPIRFHTWYGVGKLCNEFQLRVARPCY